MAARAWFDRLTMGFAETGTTGRRDARLLSSRPQREARRAGTQEPRTDAN